MKAAARTPEGTADNQLFECKLNLEMQDALFTQCLSQSSRLKKSFCLHVYWRNVLPVLFVHVYCKTTKNKLSSSGRSAFPSRGPADAAKHITVGLDFGT